METIGHREMSLTCIDPFAGRTAEDRRNGAREAWSRAVRRGPDGPWVVATRTEGERKGDMIMAGLRGLLRDPEGRGRSWYGNGRAALA